MPSGRSEIFISLTETAQFRRLVDFLQEVESHAREHDDYQLAGIVSEARDDLFRMHPRDGDES